MLNDFENENFELHWRTDFRMKFETFMRIVELVMPRLAKQDTIKKSYSARKMRGHCNMEALNWQFV